MSVALPMPVLVPTLALVVALADRKSVRAGTVAGTRIAEGKAAVAAFQEELQPIAQRVVERDLGDRRFDEDLKRHDVEIAYEILDHAVIAGPRVDDERVVFVVGDDSDIGHFEPLSGLADASRAAPPQPAQCGRRLSS